MSKTTNIQVLKDGIAIDCGVGVLVKINGFLYVTTRTGLTKVKKE